MTRRTHKTHQTRTGIRQTSAKGAAWATRAADAVAGFTSTRSKGPEAMFKGPGGPTHMVRAAGCRVETADGRKLTDWTMALGAVSLGYGNPRVTRAAVRAARDGAVGPLAPTLEVRVAERLAAAYPGAKQARFFKSGAEAVACAVRLARVATGRESVVHCGYHGWLDGPTSGAGVASGASALWHAVPFDDIAALETAVREVRPAAIVLEPVVERAPLIAWLRAARSAADASGAALIFDEVKTAFRLARGGAAERWGVRPDLAVIGKALANGFPLAAVVGRADLMARVRETWVSSTLSTELVALAAADAVLDVWERQDVAGHITRIGSRIMAALDQALEGGEARLLGLPEMWFLRFADSDIERRFLLGCVEQGVLLKRGAYNFPSLAHTERDVKRTMAAVTTSMKAALA
ncbi:MAG: aminotransferase class III-fold pyridoxal phosphate-dependent enzyme [Gemmatimonadales bacterium]